MNGAPAQVHCAPSEQTWDRIRLAPASLLLSRQICSNRTTVTFSNDPSQNTSTAADTANAPSKAAVGALQSTASRLALTLPSISTVKRLKSRNVYTSPSSKANPKSV